MKCSESLGPHHPSFLTCAVLHDRNPCTHGLHIGKSELEAYIWLFYNFGTFYSNLAWEIRGVSAGQDDLGTIGDGCGAHNGQCKNLGFLFTLSQ
jgi:hypothetical protein